MKNTDESGNAIRALWRESERRLYPLATTAPERYERVVRVARRLADDLSNAQNAKQLDAAWPESRDLVEQAATALGLSLSDLPVDDLAGVGFALRDAELRANAHQEEQRSIVEQARADGNTWARLHETGELASGLASPYQTIDLHLSSGAAIVAAVESDPMTGRPNHVLTVILMNPETGEPVDIDPGIAEVQEFSDPQKFLSARDQLTSFIDSM